MQSCKYLKLSKTCHFANSIQMQQSIVFGLENTNLVGYSGIEDQPSGQTLAKGNPSFCPLNRGGGSLFLPGLPVQEILGRRTNCC